jgi:enoyl-CoA hydratase/carnithine racemase
MGLILSAEEIDAREALRLGLVHRVVSRERLYPEAEAWARRFVDMSPTALGYAKEAVARGLDLPLADGLALEQRLSTLVLSPPNVTASLRTYRDAQAVAFHRES